MGADFQARCALRSTEASFGFSDNEWSKVRGAHAGFQLGLEILAALPLIAKKVGFYDLKVKEDMTIDIPARLLEAELQGQMKKVLVPPPEMKSDEIVSVSGGMFYSQEAPGMPLFVSRGSHFNKGDPLYVIEVMKMFNKVLAPFAGTVREVSEATAPSSRRARPVQGDARRCCRRGPAERESVSGRTPTAT